LNGGSPNARRRAALLVLCVAAGWAAAGPGHAFCDLVFKDVAEYAPIVVLVEYRSPRQADPYLQVVEVLKGRTETEILQLGSKGLNLYKPAQGDRFLLALTRERRLVQTIAGMGACSAKSVLAIRKGKVRSIDRDNWDGSGKAPNLDQLRTEFTTAP
jgi:hypothetical protein